MITENIVRIRYSTEALIIVSMRYIKQVPLVGAHEKDFCTQRSPLSILNEIVRSTLRV